jgi:hypothetical protein
VDDQALTARAHLRLPEAMDTRTGVGVAAPARAVDAQPRSRTDSGSPNSERCSARTSPAR